jgi:hypothetical protein
MSKSLTLSMSLAVALGFSGVSFAGHGTAGCDTCGLASPQGVVASPQASGQSYETCDTCTTKKKHSFKFSMPACFKPKPKCYTYEWVLKKKRVHGQHATESCDTCGTAVTPSAQYASPQGTYAAPQAYGSHQASATPTTEMKAAEPAPTGDAVPPAPTAPAPAPPAPPVPPATGAQSSLLFLAPAGN